MYGQTIFGTAYIVPGQVDVADTVLKSGTLVVEQGGEVYSTTVYGTMDVSGGYAKDTILTGGTMNVGNGAWGSDSNTEVYDGGVLNVNDLGNSYNASVYNGTENVSNGGTSWNSTIYSGGTMTVDNGGISHYATINSATMTVAKGGIALDTTINSSNEYVSGIDAYATITGQGMQIVEAGGISWGAHAENGSGLLVDSGGIAAGAKLDKNCWMLVAGGGQAQVTDFNGANANLTYMDWHDSVGSIVEGFGMSDEIDFRGGLCAVGGPGTMSVSCTENAQNTEATLTLKDTFGQTTSLTLMGQYAGAQFSAQFDGHGGIAVTDQGYSLAGVLGGHVFSM